VTYIYQRMIVIATLFHAMALYGYLRARVDGRRPYWALFASAGILACFTKQVNMSLPFTVLLTEIAFCSESIGGFFKKGIRFLPLAAVPAGLYIWMIKPDFTRLSLNTLKGLYPLNINSQMGWGEWIPTQINVMRTYLRLLVFPMNQTLDYDYPTAHGFFEPAVLVSLAVLGALLGLAVWCWRRHRVFSWGIFFMAAVLSLEFMAIRDIIFEHRLYLAMIGFSMATPAAIYALLGDPKKARSAILIALTALGIAAYARNSVWADEERFWKEELRLSPNKGRPYYSLGVYYALRGEHAKAVPLYRQAIAIWPGFADAYSNLGKSLEELGQTEESVRCYAKAVELDPTLPEGLNNFGSALVRQGKYDQARHLYAEAIQRKPDNFEAYSNMGSTYAQQGNYAEAEVWYHKSIAANPLHPDAQNNLGSILGLRKDFVGAEKCYREAIRLRPDFFEAHHNLALLCVRQERFDDAMSEYQEAVRIQPNFAEAHNSIGSLFARQKKYDEAEKFYQRALQLQPQYTDVMKNLANVYLKINRTTDAKGLLKHALQIEPKDTEALRTLKIVEAQED
jgi:tetratricopeptide (TPR) repeat protein